MALAESYTGNTDLLEKLVAVNRVAKVVKGAVANLALLH